MSDLQPKSSNQNPPVQSQRIEGSIDGLLYKYTNFPKGWQYRYFILSAEKGTLEYYMPDEKRKLRGFMHLAGSTISPSEEDSQTFIVSSACGQSYKLRAADAKERQIWVDKLRQVALDAQNNQVLDCTNEVSSLNVVRSNLMRTQKLQRDLVSLIEVYTSTDEDLLTLKALSNSIMMTLEQCYVSLLHSRKHRS